MANCERSSQTSVGVKCGVELVMFGRPSVTTEHFGGWGGQKMLARYEMLENSAVWQISVFSMNDWHSYVFGPYSQTLSALNQGLGGDESGSRAWFFIHGAEAPSTTTTTTGS